MQIITPQKKDYAHLINLWEASVRATHHFLSSESINELKTCLLNDYFPAVTLFCSCDNQQTITGFAGVKDDKLEMLFIDPLFRGQGLGKALLSYAINFFNITMVDVNEQNTQAVGFYLYQGFKLVNRSPLDGQGKPYPLLHMHLK